MAEQKWDFSQTIEQMTDEKLAERIQASMDWINENKIRKVPYLGGIKSFVEYSYPELVARCPMTGIKDTYKVKVRFIPGQFIPELKSLKFYFFGFDTLPISHEHLAAKIYKDFKEMINPEKLNITLIVAERGELDTTIEYNEDKNFGDWKGREDKDINFAR